MLYLTLCIVSKLTAIVGSHVNHWLFPVVESGLKKLQIIKKALVLSNSKGSPSIKVIVCERKLKIKHLIDFGFGPSPRTSNYVAYFLWFVLILYLSLIVNSFDASKKNSFFL